MSRFVPAHRFTRREILGAAAATSALAVLPRCGGEQPSSSKDVLVVLFLRGGVDGLSLCVPHGDDALYAGRPTLSIPPPKKSGGAIDLDGFFGLAPAASALMPAFREGRLAFVHAAGSTDPTRSHFDAMRIAEAGSPSSSRTGWLARALAATPPRSSTAVRAIAIDRAAPRSLAGARGALAVLDPSASRGLLRGSSSSSKKGSLRADLAALYGGASRDTRSAGEASLAALELLDRARVEMRQPPTGTPYPEGELGTKLACAAAWIRAGVGLEVLTVDYGGWDFHRELGARDGEMARKLDELSHALSAFDRDLGAFRDSVTLVALTEFGRRAAENASGGLDHGHGACMILLGGKLAGGRVHARWPGLATDRLDGGDLAVTTDSRDVLADVLVRRFGCPDIATVFPGHSPSARGFAL
jgi:uncharacterized protein (DUF1501 family)